MLKQRARMKFYFCWKFLGPKHLCLSALTVVVLSLYLAVYSVAQGLRDRGVVSPLGPQCSPIAVDRMRMKRSLSQTGTKTTQESKRLTAQITVHNMEKAIVTDDLMTAPGGKSTSAPGTGRWKCWLPTAMLRCAFAAGCESARSIARLFKSSSTTVSRVQQAVAATLMDRQKMNTSELVEPRVQHHHAVSSLMFDATTFEVQPTDGLAGDWPIMGMHGGVSWQPTRGSRRHEEVVIPPAVLLDECAATMINALDSQCAIPIFLPDHCAKYKALIIHSDNARANMLLYKWLESEAPTGYVVILVPCGQHNTCLCLVPMTTFLGIICPVFCLVKLFHFGAFFTGVRQHALYLVGCHLKRDTRRKPKEEDREYAEAVLELTYYNINLSVHNAWNMGVDELQELSTERRKKGNRLTKCFNGPWKSRRLCDMYHCCEGSEAGCCANEGETIQEGKDAVDDIEIVKRNPTPALNKWNETCPVVCSILLGLLFFDLLGRGLMHEYYQRYDEDDDADTEAEDDTEARDLLPLEGNRADLKGIILPIQTLIKMYIMHLPIKYRFLYIFQSLLRQYINNSVPDTCPGSWGPRCR
jgi:hypothetical protein